MAQQYVGNVLPAPGFTQGATADNDELMYSMARFTQKGVTLAPGMGVLLLGTVLGQRTTDKKWIAYADAASDGSNVARGVLRQSVDTGTDVNGPAFQGNLVISGILNNVKVIGADAAAIADLNARVDTVLGTFTI